MAAVRFNVGDRVRARVATVGVLAGALGTIQRPLTLVDDLYEVMFDGRMGSHLMREDELDPAAVDTALAAPGQA